MEKKFYITPETEVYLIKPGEICDFGAGGSADDSQIYSKDGEWEDEDWEDED